MKWILTATLGLGFTPGLLAVDASYHFNEVHCGPISEPGDNGSSPAVLSLIRQAVGSPFFEVGKLVVELKESEAGSKYKFEFHSDPVGEFFMGVFEGPLLPLTDVRILKNQDASEYEEMTLECSILN